MYVSIGNGTGANRADTIANGSHRHHGYVWHDGQWYRGEPGGRDGERATTTGTVTYGETVSGIGAKDITITTATGKTVTTTVTTKTAIKINESLPDSVAGSVGSGCETVQGGWGRKPNFLSQPLFWRRS